MKKGILFGVGVGPGDPELLTLKAVKIITQAAVIVAPKTDKGKTVALNIAQECVDLSDKTVLLLEIPMLKGREASLKAYKQGAEDIMGYLKKGQSVAFLNLGDISIYSTFGYIQPLVEEEGYSVEYISGIPSFCAAAAKFKVSLTDRDKPLHILPASYGSVAEYLKYPGSKVFMKAAGLIKDIGEALNNKGEYSYALVAENLGLPNEKLYELDKNKKSDSYFTTVLVKD